MIVQDNGPGIAPAMREEIFSRFRGHEEDGHRGRTRLTSKHPMSEESTLCNQTVKLPM